MLRRLYDWTLSLAERRDALWVLAVVSFVESSVFPIPPDVLMIPMILAAPRRAFLIAGVATVSSVLGGVLGYALGAFFFETVGEPVLGFYGYTEKFAEFQASYNEWGAWAVLAVAMGALVTRKSIHAFSHSRSQNASTRRVCCSWSSTSRSSRSWRILPGSTPYQ